MMNTSLGVRSKVWGQSILKLPVPPFDPSQQSESIPLDFPHLNPGHYQLFSGPGPDLGAKGIASLIDQCDNDRVESLLACVVAEEVRCLAEDIFNGYLPEAINGLKDSQQPVKLYLKSDLEKAFNTISEEKRTLLHEKLLKKCILGVLSKKGKVVSERLQNCQAILRKYLELIESNVLKYDPALAGAVFPLVEGCVNSSSEEACVSGLKMLTLCFSNREYPVDGHEVKLVESFLLKKRTTKDLAEVIAARRDLEMQILSLKLRPKINYCAIVENIEEFSDSDVIAYYLFACLEDFFKPSKSRDKPEVATHIKRLASILDHCSEPIFYEIVECFKKLPLVKLETLNPQEPFETLFLKVFQKKIQLEKAASIDPMEALNFFCENIPKFGTQAVSILYDYLSVLSLKVRQLPALNSDASSSLFRITRLLSKRLEEIKIRDPKKTDVESINPDVSLTMGCLLKHLFDAFSCDKDLRTHLLESLVEEYQMNVEGLKLYLKKIDLQRGQGDEKDLRERLVTAAIKESRSKGGVVPPFDFNQMLFFMGLCGFEENFSEKTIETALDLLDTLKDIPITLPSFPVELGLIRFLMLCVERGTTRYINRLHVQRMEVLLERLLDFTETVLRSEAPKCLKLESLNQFFILLSYTGKNRDSIIIKLKGFLTQYQECYLGNEKLYLDHVYRISNSLEMGSLLDPLRMKKIGFEALTQTRREVIVALIKSLLSKRNLQGIVHAFGILPAKNEFEFKSHFTKLLTLYQEVFDLINELVLGSELSSWTAFRVVNAWILEECGALVSDTSVFLSYSCKEKTSKFHKVSDQLAFNNFIEMVISNYRIISSKAIIVSPQEKVAISKFFSLHTANIMIFLKLASLADLKSFERNMGEVLAFFQEEGIVSEKKETLGRIFKILLQVFFASTYRENPFFSDAFVKQCVDVLKLVKIESLGDLQIFEENIEILSGFIKESGILSGRRDGVETLLSAIKEVFSKSTYRDRLHFTVAFLAINTTWKEMLEAT